MRTNRQPKKHVIFTLLIITVPIIIGIGGYCLWKYKFDQPKTVTPTTIKQNIDYNPPTTEQKNAGEDQKKTTTTTESTTISAYFSAINGTSDPVQIRSVIIGAVSNNGTCDLTLTMGETIVTKTATTQALPSTSTCRFDISRSELSVGTWTMDLLVTVGTETTTTTGEVTLE